MKKTNYIAAAVVAMLISSTAWAGALTIPKTFTAGSPAVAADVNANFAAGKTAVDDNNTRITTNTTDIAANVTDITALQNAKPGYARAVGAAPSNAGVGTSLTNTGQAVVTLTMNAPASGFAIVTGQMKATLDHVLNAQNTVGMKISTTLGDVVEDYDLAFVHVRAKQPTEIYGKMLTATAVIPVVAGANTIYLNAVIFVGNTNGTISWPKLTAIYVPNAY